MSAPDPRNVRDVLLEAGYSPVEVERMLLAPRHGSMVDDHRGLLSAVFDEMRSNLEAYSSHYGAFQGGDPRDFTPDSECSTEEERVAWAEACRRAEADEPGARALVVARPTVPDGQVVLGFPQVFGLGTTYSPDAALQTLTQQLAAMLESP